MKTILASITFATVVDSAWVEDPILPAAPDVKYADITVAE